MPGLTFRRNLSTAGSVSEMYSHCPRWRLVAGSNGLSRTRSSVTAATVMLDPALTQRLPVSVLDLLPFDRNVGIGRGALFTFSDGTLGYPLYERSTCAA